MNKAKATHVRSSSCNLDLRLLNTKGTTSMEDYGRIREPLLQSVNGAVSGELRASKNQNHYEQSLYQDFNSY